MQGHTPLILDITPGELRSATADLGRMEARSDAVAWRRRACPTDAPHSPGPHPRPVPRPHWPAIHRSARRPADDVSRRAARALVAASREDTADGQRRAQPTDAAGIGACAQGEAAWDAHIRIQASDCPGALACTRATSVTCTTMGTGSALAQTSRMPGKPPRPATPTRRCTARWPAGSISGSSASRRESPVRRRLSARSRIAKRTLHR